MNSKKVLCRFGTVASPTPILGMDGRLEHGDRGLGVERFSEVGGGYPARGAAAEDGDLPDLMIFHPISLQPKANRQRDLKERAGSKFAQSFDANSMVHPCLDFVMRRVTSGAEFGDEAGRKPPERAV